MATLAEQRQAAETPSLNVQVRQACIVSAQKIIDEASTVANHANRILWAKRVIGAPDSVVPEMMAYVIAKNNTLTLVQIQTASDASVQTAVDGAVDALSP
jgi:hypothetical protein